MNIFIQLKEGKHHKCKVQRSGCKVQRSGPALLLCPILSSTDAGPDLCTLCCAAKLLKSTKLEKYISQSKRLDWDLLLNLVNRPKTWPRQVLSERDLSCTSLPSHSQLTLPVCPPSPLPPSKIHSKCVVQRR